MNQYAGFCSTNTLTNNRFICQCINIVHDVSGFEKNFSDTWGKPYSNVIMTFPFQIIDIYCDVIVSKCQRWSQLDVVVSVLRPVFNLQRVEQIERDCKERQLISAWKIDQCCLNIDVIIDVIVDVIVGFLSFNVGNL